MTTEKLVAGPLRGAREALAKLQRKLMLVSSRAYGLVEKEITALDAALASLPSSPPRHLLDEKVWQLRERGKELAKNPQEYFRGMADGFESVANELAALASPVQHDWHGHTPDGVWHGCPEHPGPVQGVQATKRCMQSSAECGQCELREGHTGQHLAGYLMWGEPAGQRAEGAEAERRPAGFGPGEYSCAVCGMGMVEPCEHWKASAASHGETEEDAGRQPEVCQSSSVEKRWFCERCGKEHSISMPAAPPVAEKTELDQAGRGGVWIACTDSTPRDGEIVFVWDKGWHSSYIAQFTEEGWESGDDHEEPESQSDITHWMRYPRQPAPSPNQAVAENAAHAEVGEKETAATLGSGQELREALTAEQVIDRSWQNFRVPEFRKSYSPHEWFTPVLKAIQQAGIQFALALPLAPKVPDELRGEQCEHGWHQCRRCVEADGEK